LVFTLDVAELISAFVASEPTLRPAPVRVRVAAAQTLVGSEVMDEVIVARSEPIDEDAVLVTLFTLAATDVDAVVTVVESVPTCEFVFPFTTDATELEAVVTVVFILEVAELMSALVASEPVVRLAPVSVRLA